MRDGLDTVAGSLTNPFQYTAREFDPETSLYYYRARYYDPTAGRFISEDPLKFFGGDVDFYRYVWNSSVNSGDALGLSPDEHLRSVEFANCQSRAVPPEDWVFASPKMHGKQPYWPETLLRCYVQPTVKRLGITKQIGWHSFRRTFATLLT